MTLCNRCLLSNSLWYIEIALDVDDFGIILIKVLSIGLRYGGASAEHSIKLICFSCTSFSCASYSMNPNYLFGEFSSFGEFIAASFKFTGKVTLFCLFTRHVLLWWFFCPHTCDLLRILCPQNGITFLKEIMHPLFTMVVKSFISATLRALEPSSFGGLERSTVL